MISLLRLSFPPPTSCPCAPPNARLPGRVFPEAWLFTPIANGRSENPARLSLKDQILFAYRRAMRTPS